MSENDKPNWGNRIILLVFIALALITIAGTILSTTSLWNARDAGLMPTEDGSYIEQAP